MKKTFWILAAALATAAGCAKNSTDIKSDDFTIESSEHTITFTIDTPVEVFWITDSETSETVEGILDEDAKSMTCQGDWFSAEVNIAPSSEIILSVNENTSDKQRELIVSAYYRGRSGSTVITQEAK